jgi:S-formylglutathione hydrolase FrmB
LDLASNLLHRKVSYRVIFPVGYKESATARYSVIILLHGLFGHFNNWTDLTKLAEYASAYKFIIVTPEGGDGWYTDSISVPNDKYESYIIQELIPEIDKKFRTIADREHRVIAGLSMGGYGAIKFGLKYPDKFSLIGSFSGALDAPLRGQDNKNLRPSIISVFGPDNSQTRKDNDIFRLLRESTPDAVKGLPYIYMACGTEDYLFQPNREFDALLLEKKIPHEYRELPGSHEWAFWDAQVQEFLRLADRKIFIAKAQSR